MATKTYNTMSNELLEQLRDEMAEHAYDRHFSEAPALFVGTYGKYNAGSLDGMWVDLTTFADYDDFIGFCTLLHHDEADPEFMFPDYENFPRDLYSESMSRKDFEELMTYCELNDGQREIMDAYIRLFGLYKGLTFEHVEDLYEGKWDDEEAFAEYLLDECCFDDLSDLARTYFDTRRFARDLFLEDYDMVDGHVFRTH